MLIDVLLLHSWIHLQELVPYASLQYCHQIPVHEFSGSPSSLDWRELKEFLPRLNLRENSIVYFLVFTFFVFTSAVCITCLLIMFSGIRSFMMDTSCNEKAWLIYTSASDHKSNPK